MAPRPPADAVVALRSLGRRYRGLFAGLDEDESPDALAGRKGADGWSARDHVIAATKAVAEAAQTFVGLLGWANPSSGAPIGGSASVADDIDDLAARAEALADRLEHVTAQEWADTGAVPTLWEAVDTAVDHLRQAERTLAEVRGRP